MMGRYWAARSRPPLDSMVKACLSPFSWPVGRLVLLEEMAFWTSSMPMLWAASRSGSTCTRTANFWSPITCTRETPPIMEMRCARSRSANSLTLEPSKVSEFADLLLAQRISMIGGVSRVQVMGDQKFAVRVQVDPDRLAAHNIGIDEVQKAISSSNTNLPTGQLNGDKQSFTIESSGSLERAGQYRPIIVAYRNGVPVRLEQLGNVIDSVENDKIIALINGKPCVILAINRQPGTNTVDVVDAVNQLLPEFRHQIPPSVRLDVIFDASQSIRHSIRDVEFTLLLTVCVVVMVIFLFLRNVSATLIPGAAVP